MKKESLNIEKYLYDIDGKQYIIYLLPEEYNSTGFYIQKKGYGTITHAIGIDLEKLECSIEEYINENIKIWIDECEDAIDKIENYYNSNMEI